MNSLANSSEEHKFLDFKDTNLFTESFSVMEELRQQRKLCDVILKVEDQSFPVHRNVLASTSPYFLAMFTNDNFPESQMKEITLKEIEPSALKCLVDFAYRGEVRIDNDNVRSLIIAASLLLLDGVRDACADFLISQLNPTNVFGTCSFAKSMDSSYLATAADEYIRQHFWEVAMSDEFVELNFEDLLEIIEHDDLKVDSEETTYEAAMRWIKAKQEERAPLLPQILSKVCLPLLSSQFLVERVSREDLIRTSLQCRDLLDEVIHSHLLQERSYHLGNSRGRHGSCGNNFGKIYVVGGYNGDRLRSVEIYDPVTNKWQMGEEMPTARGAHGIAVSLEKLYAFGGNNLGGMLSTVEVFDLKIKKWNHGREMMSKRSCVGVAVLNNLIYVCGGREGKYPLNSVECFYPATDTWRKVAPMMEGRDGCGAAALRGYVYAAGGWCNGPGLASVEKYDPAKNSWIQVKPMIQKRAGLGLTNLNGKLYACGGRSKDGCLQSAEVYNPIKDVWSLISPMNCKRSGLALVGNMGKLWAIGGLDGASILSSVEVYDPVTNKWSFAVPMNVTRNCASAVVIERRHCRF